MSLLDRGLDVSRRPILAPRTSRRRSEPSGNEPTWLRRRDGALSFFSPMRDRRAFSRDENARDPSLWSRYAGSHRHGDADHDDAAQQSWEAALRNAWNSYGYDTRRQKALAALHGTMNP